MLFPLKIILPHKVVLLQSVGSRSFQVSGQSSYFLLPASELFIFGLYLFVSSLHLGNVVVFHFLSYLGHFLQFFGKGFALFDQNSLSVFQFSDTLSSISFPPQHFDFSGVQIGHLFIQTPELPVMVFQIFNFFMEGAIGCF